MTKSPAISVIVPMYNAKKYIADCLDSILAQTFKDFEVVLVNDCSPDNSRQIAENYLEKFAGRLKIYDNEKNLGASLTRNKGLKISSGEYIFFIDSDDFITPTALEEMISLMKNYNAEVIYIEKYFKADDGGKIFEKKITQGAKRVSKPTFEPENLAERVDYISRKNFWGTPWSKFVRRDFLLNNEIFFPNLIPCEDHIWTFGLFFFAKRFLRVPNAIYVRRMSKGSEVRRKRTREQKFAYWLNASILGSKFLDQMLGRIEFFQKNIQYRYAMLEKLSTHMFELSFKSSLQIPQHSLYTALKKEFGNKLGDYDVLIPLLCAIINKYQKSIEQKNMQIAELEKRLNSPEC